MPHADPALTLRASDCPGVLRGWTGAVIAETRVGLRHGVYCDDVGRVWYPDEVVAHHEEVTGEDAAHLLLDLSRPEVADHVARWVAGRVGLAVGATAPGWRRAGVRPRRWWLDSGVPFEAPGASRTGLRGASIVVPALADLDPADDTRTASGARVVDLAALVCVARHIRRTA
jgi:hypothetical protein